MKGHKKLVYLFCGQEDFLIEEEVDKLKKELITPGFETFGSEIMDGKEVGADQIISSIQTMPMLGGQKVVIIKNTTLFKRAPSEIDQLISSIKGLKEGVILVFTCSEVDRRLKLYKTIEKVGAVKEFRPFAEWEQNKLMAWIVERAKGEGKHIGAHAASQLSEISGANLRQLAAEIEKLSIYVGERQSIEETDVATLASAGGVNVFYLLSALRDKNLPKALATLNSLLKNREAPVRLLQLLVTQYRRLLQVKTLEEKGMGASRIAQRLQASPYFVRKCLEKSHNFSLPELCEIMERLHETDIKLKTSGEPVQLVLELLLCDLCCEKEEPSLAR